MLKVGVTWTMYLPVACIQRLQTVWLGKVPSRTLREQIIPLTAAGEPLLAYSLSSPIGIIEYHPELILLMLFRGYCDMQPNKDRLYIEGYHRYHSQI